MPISGATTKYYVLSVLGALVVAFGVLAVAPSVQAQVQPPTPPSIDKECTPNPVQIGEQITCTIVVVPPPSAILGSAVVTDKLPDGLRVTGATTTVMGPGGPVECAVAGNTVTCPSPVTIEATAVQCGTFTNTATANGTFTPQFQFVPFSIQDTEEITVVGCEEAGGGGVGAHAAPITQESEQESESGEIDQTFEVS